MRPHIAPNLLSPTFGDKEQRPERAEALARLKSVNAFSVRAYQVIELPRSPQDPPEGTLHLALGPTSTRAGGAAPAPTWARQSTWPTSVTSSRTSRGRASSPASWSGVRSGH